MLTTMFYGLADSLKFIDTSSMSQSQIESKLPDIFTGLELGRNITWRL